MKDLKLKQGVLKSIMAMCDDMDLEPLKPKKPAAIAVEIEPVEEAQEEAPKKMSDKVADMIQAKAEPKSEDDDEEEMKRKLMELYSQLKD